MLRKLCAVCLFLLWTPQISAGETYPIQLTNDSGAAITSIIFAPVDPAPPYGVTGTPHEVKIGAFCEVSC